MKTLLTAAIALAAIAASPAQAAKENLRLGVCEAEMARASVKFGVPLPILYAVGLTESGGNGTLQPLLVATKKESYVGLSVADAIKRFNQIRAATGSDLIDLGCMQANFYWHRAEFKSLEQMFDPRANVEQAARFLSELYKRHGSWIMAAARYNAGPNNTPAQQRYVCIVMRNLVRSGFGSWTPQAKAFCDAEPVQNTAAAKPAPVSPALVAPVSIGSSAEESASEETTPEEPAVSQ
ncbi:lytic transglycosylase domain-containing protein [Aquabacter sp. CN5-332]|uniref:lytic transglycosylase domain-containing protein n=1 Tax=Aquabacter sp. CN5-332 TaxID=3156608 RepID=UPI0032B386CF